ncbi:MAG TPA: hypothetical protein VKA54_14685 [Gemmatimonadaceae bacterium]|nr:hypothetical protein [Gemmatimonadaceae bacterium]
MSSRLRRLSRADLAALLALVALAIALPALYVSSERVVYASDLSGFQQAAVSTALELRSRLATGIRATLGMGFLVWRSTGWDYSLLPAVLPAPILLALHGGRVTYIVTCAVLYLVPFVLLLGATAAALAPERKRRAFWFGAVAAVALPALWLPTLRGYPDAGASALVAAALVLFLRDTELRLRWTPAAIGVCLAVAILFRRHFAYPALSLMVVIGGYGLLAAVDRLRTRTPGRSVARVIVGEMSGAMRAATWFGGALVLLGPGFVVRAMRTNYTDLYASYMRPPAVIAGSFAEQFGWAAWILATLGYVAAWHWRALDRRRLALVLVVMLLTLGLWTFRVRQIGVHYALHAVPLITLGHFALAWTVTQRARGRPLQSLFVVGAASYAIVNAVRGLAPLHDVPPALEHTRWLATSRPPLRWSDYDEIVRLVRDLRREAGRTDPVYVAASGALRSSSVRSADLMLDDPFRPGVRASDITWGSRLYVPHTPHIDSRDGNPTTALLQAKYVVVATPVQYHLSPDEQHIVRTAVEEFTEGRPLARDFEVLPDSYTLADSARVRVYRRTRPSSEAASLETFARFRAALGARYERPVLTYLGTSADVIVNGAGRGDRAANAPLSSDMVALVVPDSAGRGSHLRASVRTAGTGCERVRVSALALPGDTLLSSGTPTVSPQPLRDAVDLPLNAVGSSVLLHLWRDSAPPPDAGPCRLWISNIAVTTPP